MSTSPAAPERQRLFSPAVIVVLGVLVSLMLTLAFPREKLRERLLDGHDADSLTLAYLQAWLRVDPNNTEVLSELARQYLKGHQISDADRVIERLARSNNPEARASGLAIRLGLAQQRLYALAPDDPARAARQGEFDALLHEAIEYTWNGDQLKELARQARALNDGALAHHFYMQLVAVDPLHANQWRAADAEAQLASGRYREAADAWFAVQANAPTRGDRRAAFLAGLRALQAGNLLHEAIDAAQAHVGELAGDAQTLRFLVALGMAAGRPDLAATYVKRLLQMSQWHRNDGEAGWPRIELASFRTDDARPMRIPAGGAMLMRVSSSADPVARPKAGIGNLAGSPQEDADHGDHASQGAATPAGPQADMTLPPSTADEDLGYRVFLANGDVARAQRVAQRALEKAPGSYLWLQRLAQVAEWNHQPDVALNSWFKLARSRGDDAAWQQVARLAPGVNDPAATLAVMLYQSNRAPDDLTKLDAVVNAYERLGDPAGGLAFLAGRQQGPIREAVMARYAALAERRGDDDLALRTWRQLEHEYGPNATYSVKIATILYVRAQFDDALAAIAEAQHVAAKDDAHYWRFYARLASISQRPDRVNAAYRGLLATSDVQPDDYDAMVGFYSDAPLDAGRLAELAYRKNGQVRMLQQAVYHYQLAHALGRLAALLDSLSAQQRAQAEQFAPFLLARAQYRQQKGDVDGAADDIARAVALAPDNPDVQVAYLWSLIERGTTAQLRSALHHYADDAQRDPALWGPYAQASLRLGDGRAALHYLHLQAATSSQDPIWQLTWADALEMNGRLDDAWRVRRHVWIEMAHRQHDKTQSGMLSAEQQDDLRGRMVALSQTFANGDRSRAILIDMVRADNARAEAGEAAGEGVSELGNIRDFDRLPPAQRQSLRDERALYLSVAREAMISWAQGEGESDLERAWLVRNYIDSSTQPVYAQAQLAISDGDVNALERLLDTLPDQMPRQNKVDAEVLKGRYAAAQSDAFDSMTRLPDDEVMQSQLSDQLLRSAQSVATALRYVDEGPLTYTEASLTGGLRFTPAQSLLLRYMDRLQSTDGVSLPYAPRNDQLFEAIYRHQGQFDDERLALGRRHALDDFMTARIEGRYSVSSALTVNWALGYNQAATETTQLQVGGTKDIVSAGADYRFGPHWFAGGRYEYARFHGQDRSTLGDGQLVELNAGYKINVDYPDYTVRVVLSHGQYSANGTPGTQLGVLLPPGTPLVAASFMPQNVTVGGLLFSFGDDLPESYSKGWRPMFSAGPLRDSRTGWSGEATIGMVGSVFGNDQALIYAAYQGASTGHSTSVKEAGVRYRWMY